MKLYFLGILLLSFTATASNWMRVSDIQNKGVAGYSFQGDCERGGEQCLDVDPYAVEVGAIALHDVYGGARLSVDECEGKTDCEEKLASKQCLDSQAPFIDEDYKIVYCMKAVGKESSLNSSLLAQKLTEKNQKAQYEAALGQATKAMDCGRRVIAVLIVRNASKSLTTQQVGQMVATYAQPKGLLETGSLVTAKEVISSITADGLLVTEADKTALTSEIDNCKP